MEVVVIRITRSLSLGTLVMALGLGAVGCSGGGGGSSSPEKNKENAMKGAEGMRRVQEIPKKKGATGAGDGAEGQKEKENAKDNGKGD